MPPESSGPFEEQVLKDLHDLRAQVQRMEAALRLRGILFEETQNPAPVRVTTAQTVAIDPAVATIESQIQSPLPRPSPPPAPLPPMFGAGRYASQAAPQAASQAVPQAAAQAQRSLESRVGSQWFNRIGILAVLIGVALFLKLAFDNHLIGPLGRILIGLVAGAGLIAWSERFQRKGYPLFGYSLKAIGSGTLYLSLWAAYSVFHLIPSSAAFAAMIAVTAFNGFMAWIQDAELLALYAIVGALTTPLLLSTGGNHEVFLFTYLLMLDLAVLILVILRPWSRLLFMAFFGTVSFFVGWWLSFYSSSGRGITCLFTTCFFLIFALAPRLIRLRNTALADVPGENPHAEVSGWDVLASLVLPVLNAIFGFIVFYALFDIYPPTQLTPWAGAIEAVLFAAFYLTLLRLPAAGILRPTPPSLAALHLTTAIVFLSIAIPLKAHGRWLTIGWLIEGAALLWTSTRQNSKLLRILGLICLVMGLTTLILINPLASATPILNQRFATYCLSIAVYAFVAWLANQQHTTRAFAADHQTQLDWQVLTAVSILIVNALALVALSYEIHNYWWQLRWHRDWLHYNDFTIEAQFTYSALFMVYGAALLTVGFRRHSAFLRWQALALLAVAIAKVFVADVSHLSEVYRVISFLALGALLLGVSFVYQRDWLKLRNPVPEAAASEATHPEQPIP